MNEVKPGGNGRSAELPTKVTDGAKNGSESEGGFPVRRRSANSPPAGRAAGRRRRSWKFGRIGITPGPPERPTSGPHHAAVSPAGARSSTDLGILALRIGIGTVWLANLMYIIDPANRWFPTFAATVRSFGPTSYGGPGLAGFVADHPEIFALAIAGVTAYLALAFLTGLSVRVACVAGAVFNLGLLATQFTTLTIPGGTDVGPHPLYLVAYVGLFVARGGPLFSVDPWAHLRRVRWSRGLRSPRRSSGRSTPGAEPVGAASGR